MSIATFLTDTPELYFVKLHFYNSTNSTQSEIYGESAIALVTFFHPDSTNLALNAINETSLFAQNPLYAELFRPSRFIMANSKLVIFCSISKWFYYTSIGERISKLGWISAPNENLATLDYIAQTLPMDGSVITIGTLTNTVTYKIAKYPMNGVTILASVGGLIGILMVICKFFFGDKKLNPWGIFHVLYRKHIKENIHQSYFSQDILVEGHERMLYHHYLNMPFLEDIGIEEDIEMDGSSIKLQF